MNEAVTARTGACTWRDYRTWDDDRRWEVVGGAAYAMSPSPTARHQRVVATLIREFEWFLKGRPCLPFPAPMDVRLSEVDVVQPDIVVVCDPERIRATHIEGAPTLVVEILSRSSWRHDRIRKFNLYARFGVREYWLANPHPACVEVFALRDGAYVEHGTFRPPETVTSPTFADLAMPLDRVFDLDLPDPDGAQEVHDEPAARYEVEVNRA